MHACSCFNKIISYGYDLLIYVLGRNLKSVLVLTSYTNDSLLYLAAPFLQPQAVFIWLHFTSKCPEFSGVRSYPHLPYVDMGVVRKLLSKHEETGDKGVA